MTKIPIRISSDGVMRRVCSDETHGLSRLIGPGFRSRASHVEPDKEDNNLWNVDMSPYGGPPSLGKFSQRSEALREEAKWLKKNL